MVGLHGHQHLARVGADPHAHILKYLAYRECGIWSFHYLLSMLHSHANSFLLNLSTKKVPMRAINNHLYSPKNRIFATRVHFHLFYLK